MADDQEMAALRRRVQQLEGERPRRGGFGRGFTTTLGVIAALLFVFFAIPFIAGVLGFR